ncbi:MAG: hypothetical protein OXT71_14970 [Acidobacteriota bacterium]|nr:hypothetical protein [Acidobacteriota bacterium]
MIEVPVEELVSDDAGTGTDLVVFEIPADEPFEEDEQRRVPGRVRRLLSGIGRLARRVNPAAPITIALRRSGGAVKSVVVAIRVRRLAEIVREFQPGKAPSARRVAKALRRAFRRIDPALADQLARKAYEPLQKAITELDPVEVGEAVRRLVEGIDLDGKRRGGRRWSKALRGAMPALAAIGPEEAGRIAEEATRAIQGLVAELDPDWIGERFRELVEAAQAASGEGRRRLIELLAWLTDKAKLVRKKLVQNVRPCEVLVVLLLVVRMVPKLRALVQLLSVLYTILCDRPRSDGSA